MIHGVIHHSPRVCVLLPTSGHLTLVGFVLLVCPHMLEAVAGVGVGFVAAWVGAHVGLFSWRVAYICC